MSFCEEHEDIDEERSDWAGFLGAHTETDGGFAREGRPVATGKIGKDQQRFPDVGGAIVEFERQLWLCCGDSGSVIGDKTEALLLERQGIQVPGAVAFLR